MASSVNSVIYFIFFYFYLYQILLPECSIVNERMPNNKEGSVLDIR